ncbi:hypothetical protein AU577_09100 [Salmonella enterica subsp. enterica serovar Alachua]|nr:hypothetical protein [Salmonella enterica subsp. enterica serovar Alachua]
MTNNQLTTERLEIMLAETLGTTAARGKQASIEVNASIFVSVLTEVLESRKEDTDLPPVFTCSECGFETSDPEGRHYCHEDNSDE